MQRRISDSIFSQQALSGHARRTQNALLDSSIWHFHSSCVPISPDPFAIGTSNFLPRVNSLAHPKIKGNGEGSEADAESLRKHDPSPLLSTKTCVIVLVWISQSSLASTS